MTSNAYVKVCKTVDALDGPRSTPWRVRPDQKAVHEFELVKECDWEDLQIPNGSRAWRREPQPFRGKR